MHKKNQSCEHSEHEHSKNEFVQNDSQNLRVTFLGSFFILLIRFYRISIGLIIGGQCRFYPSCSEYAILSFKQLPPLKALYYSVGRIFRCNPWNDGGVDYPKVAKKDEDV